jgi:hypothetical protein
MGKPLNTKIPSSKPLEVCQHLEKNQGEAHNKYPNILVGYVSIPLIVEPQLIPDMVVEVQSLIFLVGAKDHLRGSFLLDT